MLCGICGKEFEPKHFNQKLCSEECKQQARKNSIEKYKKSDKGKEAIKRWHQSDRFKENEKRYRQNPVARHKAVIRQKEYLKTHLEAIEKKRERDRKYGHTDKGRVINNKATAKYRQTEKGKLSNRKQKHIRRAAGDVDKKYISMLLDGKICYYCGCEIQDKKTIDHKTPVIKGGTNENDNLVLSCLHCNTQKGSKTEYEYKEWLNGKNNL